MTDTVPSGTSMTKSMLEKTYFRCLFGVLTSIGLHGRRVRGRLRDRVILCMPLAIWVLEEL